MYPPGYQTFVQVRDAGARACAARSRPDHFVGVATVVCKLFNIVRPHVALFGEKDFQQLAVIRRMVADLDMPVEIVGLPTVREPDGLAMSSRNKYLSPDERQRALALSRGLGAARALFDGRRARRRRAGRRRARRDRPRGDRVDYVELRDADDAGGRSASASTGPAVLAVAAFVGDDAPHRQPPPRRLS